MSKVRARAVVAPVGQRLDECEKFCERASKRLEKAQEAVAEALKAQTLREEELAEGQRRLSELRTEAAAHTLPDPPTVPGSDEVTQLRRQVAQMESDLRQSRRAASGEEELLELRREVEELRQFRDKFPASVLKSSSLSSEADGKRRRVLALTEGAASAAGGSCEHDMA